MKRFIPMIAATALFFGFSQMAPAQQAEPAEAPQVSTSDLSTFVDIYVDLQATAARYEQQMAAAESAEEAQTVQEQMHEDSVSAIEAHGWSLDRYNAIAQAVNANPDLVQEALRLIEDRS